jgi:hypothetical protein
MSQAGLDDNMPAMVLSGLNKIYKVVIYRLRDRRVLHVCARRAHPAVSV